MAEYTERQLLEIAVTGTEQVEASAAAFLKEEGAAKRAAAETYAFAETAKEAASPVYNLAQGVEEVGEKATASKPGLSAVDFAMEKIAESAKRAEIQLTHVTTTAGKTQTASKGLSQNMTGLSYAFNDFFGASGDISQRLNAIANNLPMLLAGFGGLGLALSALVPVIALVIRNWELFSKAFGAGVESIKDQVTTLKDRIKELEDKPVKLTVDVLELEDAQQKLDILKKGLAAFEAAQQTRTTPQKESGQEVASILAEESPGGEGATAAAIRAQLAHEKLAPHAEEFSKLRKTADEEALRAEQASAAGAVENAAQAAAVALAARERIASIEKAASDDAKAEAGTMLDNAKKGDVAAQRALAENLRKVGRRKLAESIEGASPDALAAAHAEELADQREQKRLEEMGERQREKARKDQRRAEIEHKATEDATNFEVEHEAKLAEFLDKQAEKEGKTGDTKAAREKKAAEAKATKDRASLTTGLGEDFLADAAAARIAIFLHGDENDRKRFEAELKAQAAAKLKGQFGEVEAARLAQGAGALVTGDVRQRADQARAAFGQPQAPDELALQTVQQQLAQQRLNRPRPAPRAVPKALNRRGRGAAGQAPAVSSVDFSPKGVAARKRANAAQAKADRVAKAKAEAKAPAPANFGPSLERQKGPPQAANGQGVPPALIQGAGQGVENTGKLIQVAGALLTITQQQGQEINRLAAMTPNGLRSRPGGPRARG